MMTEENINTVCFLFLFFFFFLVIVIIGEIFFWENTIKIIITSALPIKGRALMTVQYCIGSAETLNHNKL